MSNRMEGADKAQLARPFPQTNGYLVDTESPALSPLTISV